MIVKGLKWISESTKEAELIISDGNKECLAFSQPCNYKIGDKISEPLQSFITENLMISHNKNVGFQKRDSESFSYKCVAIVADPKNNLVKIGNISVLLDEKIPEGCNFGTIVEFFCERLDVVFKDNI